VPLFFLDPHTIDANGNPTLQQLVVPVLDYVATTPGGDTQLVTNLEYRVPIVGPVSMSIFWDMGLNGLLRRGQLQLDPSGISQLRQRFPSTKINSRLDVASGSNFRPRSSAGLEFVVQLPVVNAPFRIYWAYNFLRYSKDIFEPPGDFNVHLGDELCRRVSDTVCEAQILPQLNAQVQASVGRYRPFEPLKTFRFTVSRTF
jgi:outer membrane protein insertion porin family